MRNAFSARGPNARARIFPRESPERHTTMTSDESNVRDWVRLIQAEYLEMPGLHLTKPQVQRLWTLEPWICDAVLDALVEKQVLRKTPRNEYALAGR
jgi:hypothetical protein